jgi:IclR family pca regulon transcriptional regulator
MSLGNDRGKFVKDRDHLQSLERGLLILDLLSQSRSPLKLERLVQLSGISKTSCFRILKTLTRLGFVVREAKEKAYGLGPKTISIGLSALESQGVRELALPFMREIREKTGATVNLAVLDGSDVVFVERLQSANIMEANLRVGSRLSAHCSSMGKAILAFMPDSDLDRILERIVFERKTEMTITSKEDLRRELREVRQRGYALNNEELEKGLFAVAGPIRDRTGEAVAAMNISCPLTRHSKEEVMQIFCPMVVSACKEISSLLGFKEGAS